MRKITVSQTALWRVAECLTLYRDLLDLWTDFEQAPGEPERLLALLDILAAFEDVGAQWVFTLKEPSFKKWNNGHAPARLAVERFGVCCRIAWEMCRAGALELSELDRVAKYTSRWLDRGHDEILTVLDFAKFDYQRSKARTAKTANNEAVKKEPDSMPGTTRKNPKRRNGGTD
jgi:hypothetical protein